jgi:hypothetical protein
VGWWLKKSAEGVTGPLTADDADVDVAWLMLEGVLHVHTYKAKNVTKNYPKLFCRRHLFGEMPRDHPRLKVSAFLGFMHAVPYWLVHPFIHVWARTIHASKDWSD